MQNDVVQQAISEQFNQCQCLETRGPVVGVGHCQGNSVIKDDENEGAVAEAGD